MSESPGQSRSWTLWLDLESEARTTVAPLCQEVGGSRSAMATDARVMAHVSASAAIWGMQWLAFPVEVGRVRGPALWLPPGFELKLGVHW